MKTALLERIPFKWNRNSLYFSLSGRIFWRRTGVHFAGKCSSRSAQFHRCRACHPGAGRRDHLARHAKAQAFLSRYHRGALLKSAISNDSAVRANAVRGPDGKLSIYGGDFGMKQHTLRLSGVPGGAAVVEYMGDTQIHKASWDGHSPLVLPPMTLFRIVVQ